jgi:nitrous oxidase accessory protein
MAGSASGQVSLADLVAAAAPGDTVLVPPGVYREGTLIIDKPLSLIGEDWPIVDGQGERGLIEVTGGRVTISGLVFRNTGLTFMDDRAAIKLFSAADCSIKGNRFEETFFAIYLAEADGCVVEGNTIVTTPDREVNGGNAIHSWHSTNLLISGNEISGHRDGIYLEFTEDSLVKDNVSSDNLRYGLHFMFSDRCVYQDNTFERNGAGVAVMYGEDVEMTGNLFLDSWGASSFGLLLKEIKGGSVSGNTFSGNSIALYVESTDRLDFEGNRFERNGWAIRVMADALDNRFVQNTFVRNTFDVSTNSRRTAGSTFEGNYWDRYDGYDLDRDGLGDKPFHPVRLYSLLVEQHEPALVLLRSSFVTVLDAIEAVVPMLTPEALVDRSPSMEPLRQ